MCQERGKFGTPFGKSDLTFAIAPLLWTTASQPHHHHRQKKGPYLTNIRVCVQKVFAKAVNRHSNIVYRLNRDRHVRLSLSMI